VTRDLKKRSTISHRDDNPDAGYFDKTPHQDGERRRREVGSPVADEFGTSVNGPSFVGPFVAAMALTALRVVLPMTQARFFLEHLHFYTEHLAALWRDDRFPVALLSREGAANTQIIRGD